MTDHQNFKNGDNHFNIFLNENGDLEFNANGDSGGGDTRMVISNVASQVRLIWLAEMAVAVKLEGVVGTAVAKAYLAFR